MRRMVSREGDALVKTVVIKIFSPGNKKFNRYILRANPGCGHTPDGIEKMLQKVASDIEAQRPGHEYSLVPLGKAAFNFVWQGQKPAEAIA